MAESVVVIKKLLQLKVLLRLAWDYSRFQSSTRNFC